MAQEGRLSGRVSVGRFDLAARRKVRELSNGGGRRSEQKTGSEV